MAAPAIELVICYAHDDADDPKKLFQQLRKQLCSLERKGLIRIWDDREILAGTPYADDIESHLNGAGIILLIASASFIASDYCYEKELPRALARHKDGTVRVLTVLLHPCYWQDTDLRQFPVLPDNHQPISDAEHWSNPDKALLNITEGVRRFAIELQVMELGKLGQKHTWAGEHDQALAIYNEALALNEQYKYEVSVSSQTLARLYQGRGIALTSARRSFPPFSPEKRQEALEAFEQAVQLDPALAYSHEQRGALLYELECCEEALLALDEAIRLGEEAKKQGAIVPISPFITKFQVLLQLNRTDEAQAFYQQELKDSFPDLPIHRQAAEIFERAGRYEQALAAYEHSYPVSAISSYERDDTYYKTKARLLKHLMRYEEALAVLSEYEHVLVKQRSAEVSFLNEERASVSEKELAFCSLNKGLLLELLGRDHEALAAFDAAIVNRPDEMQAHFGRQRIYEQMARQAEKRAEGYIGQFRLMRSWKSHHSGPVCCLACSPDGRFFASGGADEAENGLITLWGLPSGQELRTLHGHAQRVECLTFSPHGVLHSGSNDATVIAWGWPSISGKMVGAWNCPSGVLSIAISPGGLFFASGGSDGMVRLYDRRPGKELRAWRGYTHHPTPVRAVAFSPDGLLLSGSEDGTVNLWKSITGEEFSTTHRSSEPICSVIFGGLDAQPITGDHDGAIIFYDFSLRTSPLGGFGRHGGLVTSLVIPSDRRYLVSGSLDGTLNLWDVAPFELRKTLDHGGPVSSLALSPDGCTLVSGGEDGTLKLWRLQ